MQKTFGLQPSHFEKPEKRGLDAIDLILPGKLGEADLSALSAIVGKENVQLGAIDRLRAAYGKTMFDLFRLRERTIENVPDAVVLPRNNKDVQAILAYCASRNLPVQPLGAGSSVTRGFEAVRGGITLNLSTHMNRVLDLDPISETVTVESGIMGPALESILQNAKKEKGMPHNYTCGHFPQSFEHTTVGGWVVTRGAGQNSTYYGKIEDIVVAQHYITPAGELVTANVPAQATGPDLDSLMMGSEGSFGILVSTTLKIRRFLPETRRRFGYVFPDFESGLNATREIMQSQCGVPSVFRLSDPEETDLALELYGVAGTPLEWIMRLFGLKKNKRSLMIGWADGDAAYTDLVHENIQRICRRAGAMSTTGFVTSQWEKSRFLDPYMRDDLMDFGIILDTLECSASWKDLPAVYASVRAACHMRPNTIVTTHLSHFYPQGANLYFIFIGQMEREEFVEYHKSIVDAIQASGAAITHHHGIGRLLAPWFPTEVGPVAFGLLNSIKKYLDPQGILNPGVLGLARGENK